MMLASMLRLMIICMTTFWIVSFSVGRFFVFYEAYTSTLRIIRDEAWIRAQCADPQFYSNLKQHSDLCQSVQINFERSPFLVALNAVSETAHLCGRYSCTENLMAISRGGWPVMLSVGFFSLLAPTLLVQVMRLLMSSSSSSGGGNSFRGVLSSSGSSSSDPFLLPKSSSSAGEYHAGKFL